VEVFPVSERSAYRSLYLKQYLNDPKKKKKRKKKEVQELVCSASYGVNTTLIPKTRNIGKTTLSAASASST